MANKHGLYLRGTQLLDAEASQPLTHVNGLVQSLALDEASDETTGKGIAGTVGVVDLLLADGVDGEGLDVVGALLGHDGGLSAVGDDGDTGALGVLLGQVGQVLGDGGNVSRGDLEAVRLGVGGGLGLVADDVVPVLGRLVKGVLEELGDEGGSKVDDEDLVVGGGLLTEGLDGGRADWFVVLTLRLWRFLAESTGISTYR